MSIGSEYVTGPGGRVVEIDLVPIASSAGTIQGTPSTTTQTVYVHADAMGSTRVLTDASGHPILGYTYDPYGQASATTLSASTVSIINPFLFQGQFVDPLSGFIHLRNRWYDPTTAQFLTRDPLDAATLSAYGYGHGDPVNASDPSGLCPVGPVSPTGPSCPQLLKNLAQFLGYGDYVRLGWDLLNGRVNIPDLKGSGVSAAEQGLISFFRFISAKYGIVRLGAMFAPKWVTPVNVVATVVDGVCTIFDTLNQQQ